MRAEYSSDDAALRIKAAGIIYLLICSFTLVSTGCRHKMPLEKRVFSLEGPPEFPIMAPSGSPNTTGDDFQEYQVDLRGKDALANPLRVEDCTVKGTVFSLAPAKTSNSDLWVITSLNVEGWKRRSDSTDVQAEWMHFARQVLALHRSGCFPKDKSPQEVLQQISEAIPLPASEELLYSYSFGRPGFVDLVPGMQLVIERASFESRSGVRVPASPTNKFSERLAVVRRHPAGSALRLLEIESRGLGKTFDKGTGSPRSIPDRFAASPQLRLMLLTLRNDDTRRFPVLLGSTDTLQIWDASDKIAGGTLQACPDASSSGLQCMFFDKDSTVSVLISVWVNGRHSYRPLSTTLGSLIGLLPESEANRALETVSIDRPLLAGGYARVNFPHDMESASKIILLNGDRLTWGH
jgi:hypothetical protein